jgi:GDP-D-mannose dehydratase
LVQVVENLSKNVYFVHESVIRRKANYVSKRYNTTIFIGSQNTKHIGLQKDDLDHVGHLTRSIHEAQSGEDNHLATVMDP